MTYSKFSQALVIGVLALVPSLTAAQSQDHDGISPYAGEETRAIKSLSAEDIAELRRGGGWGLAKAAELNGMPGPAHLLELKSEIPLTAQQVSEIEALFDTMRQDAIREGEQLIAAERSLEDAFRSRNIDEARLARMLAAIGKARTALRTIHLSTHLAATRLLTEGQIDRYNDLRGYGQDPCATVPEGHDPARWRQHNDCG